MKKIIVVLFSFSMLGNALFAQNADFKNTISLHYGVSLFNLAKGSIEPPDQTPLDSIRYKSGGLSNIPTIGFAWDYGVAKWFSIGIAASYNQAKATVTGLEVRNNQGTFDKLGDISLTIPRTTFATRLLFHYGNKGRIDCYTGFRLGVGLWSPKLNIDVDQATFDRIINELVEQSGVPRDQLPSSIESKLKTRAIGILPQAQFIPFGIRGYVTENIGINGELAIGSPYYLSIGANYRF
jgi:hypothetical protein